MKKLLILALMGLYPIQYSLAQSTDFQLKGTPFQVDNPHFTNVVVQQSMDVVIRCDAEFSIQALGDADDMDDLRIATKGKVLNIGQKKPMFTFFGFGKSPQVMVTVPPKNQILSITASDSSNVTFDKCATSTQLVALNAAGSSTLTGHVASRTGRFYMVGSSDMNVTGEIKGLNLRVMGSSSFNTNLQPNGALKVRDVRLSVSGSSDVRLCNVRDIIGDVAGSSDLVYGYIYDKKPRTLRISNTGSSKITPKHCAS